MKEKIERSWWLQSGRDSTGPFATREEAVAFGNSEEGMAELPPDGEWKPRKNLFPPESK